ncbi:MAG TPA: TIGR03086 family metal-binding protein [Mycobacteriales bacterium]|jgi:uncharacterized protein (TIGR03086 family)|nr:TIGR03086 family metal-binding protein [Mycobacteriales bacterium]
MTDPGIRARYDRAATAFTATVTGAPSDCWDSPSPCPGWTATQLLQHVVDNVGLFFGLADVPAPQTPAAAEDPTAAWSAADAATRAVLADPAVADREFDGYFGRTTLAEAIDRFLSFDLVVHRWDLARATGQDEHIDPQVIAETFTAARNFGDALRAENVCGPAIPVADDADEQTRLLAFLGRKP